MSTTTTRAMDDINPCLHTIEELAPFLVTAKQRFRKGQRVQFSRAADHNLISHRIKGGVRKGRVVAIDDGFMVKVLLDGYRSPSKYHHIFFDAVGRKS